MIELKRINGSMVTPKDDALLFDYLFSGSGIFEGVEVTHLGANQLLVTDGRGMILGRDFVVAEETILAQLSPSGTQRGRLLVRIDMANTEIPIVIATQIGAVLPELVQEDINRMAQFTSWRLWSTTQRDCKSQYCAVSHPISQKLKLSGYSALRYFRQLPENVTEFFATCLGAHQMLLGVVLVRCKLRR